MTTLPRQSEHHTQPLRHRTPESPLYTLRNSPIAGVFELRCRDFRDHRGSLAKTFHIDAFAAMGLATDFAEDFYSTSRRGVLRGLHLQLPPMACTKLITVAAGQVLDAVVDLRRGSPTFGMHATIPLDSSAASVLYVPPGVAHGYYVRGASAVVLYKMSQVHSAACDGGIAWNSCGIDWPDRNPILSDRDAALPPLEDFATSFTYEPLPLAMAI
jgi:dTDP-4-dehydrorhamnose 3,5-epimerase